MNKYCQCCNTVCDEKKKKLCLERHNHALFVPIPGYEKYFSRGWYCACDHSGPKYDWDSRNKNLVPTTSIEIDGNEYCPYCGTEMWPIQADDSSYAVTGHMCLCEGGRTELEYKQKVANLEQELEQKLINLRSEYIDRLQFDTKKLFEIKTEIERKQFNFFKPEGDFFRNNGGKSIPIKKLFPTI